MELPTIFGRYQLLDKIAQGGMADVFLARTFGVEGFEKRLVIKRILPGLSRSTRFVTMFINEARILTNLNHPNIVQVYELGRHEGYYFIAMEYIHGKDLTRVVRAARAAESRLTIPLAVFVVSSTLRGLGYAHAVSDDDGIPLGIVHGDVSPHNLVVSFAGETKLVDFGIARLAGKGRGDQKGRPGGGKFAYMSPEQVAGMPMDQRSDVFSAGIVLYELLVDHRLYQHDDPEEKLRLVREAVVPDPRKENPLVPDDLWDIVRKALARYPEDRYATADTFEEDLRAFLYANHHQADTSAMATFMEGLFQEEYTRGSPGGDMRRLADDLRRLERGLSAPRLSTGGTAPSQSIPTSTPNSAGTAFNPTAEFSRELKTVAVASIEICGHTDIGAISDPYLIVERQRKLLDWFQRQAQRFGGMLAPGADDTVTLVCGMRRTREGDLERALNCALTLLKKQQRGWGDSSIQFCIGVHFGEAAMAGSGNGSDSRRIVGRGDTLKLARHLANSADLGQVLVSERVVQLASRVFQFQGSSPLCLRGREIPTWKLAGKANLPTSDVGCWLVRGSEIRVLQDAMLALGQGSGRTVLITAEPGLGKSRLTREIQRVARRRGLPFYVARSFPFGADRPFAVFSELLASIIGAVPGDPQMSRKLARLTQLGLPDEDRAVLSALIASSAHGRPISSPEAVFEAGRRLVIGLLEEGPLVLVVEDISQLDSLERRLVRSFSSLVPDHPLLLLLTSSNPMSAESLAQVDSHIQLSPLSADAQARLIKDILGTDQVDPDLARLVTADSAGNPLFTHELIRVLRDGGHIQRKGKSVSLRHLSRSRGLPHTLRGLVAARLDSLSPESKAVLQIGATIGMRFPTRLLEEAARQDNMRSIEADLLARGLLVKQQGGWLAFPSKVVWDLAAHSTLGRQRRHHHLMIAEGMKRVFSGQLEPHLESLARHLAAGGRLLDAVESMERSGRLHQQGAFLEHALESYELALEWLEELRRCELEESEFHPEDAQREVTLYRLAGEVSQLLGRSRPAERYLQIALEDANEHGIIQEEAAACLSLGRLYRMLDRRIQARACLEQALEIARARNLEELELMCLEELGQLTYDEGEPGEAERIYEELLARSGTRHGMAARALLGLGTRCIDLNEYGQAMHNLQRAMKLARLAGDKILLGRIVNNIGIVYHAAGRYEQALKSFRQALVARKGSGYRMGVIINLHNIGDTHFRMEDYPRAYADFEQSAELAMESGWERGVAMNQVFLGFLDAVRGNLQGLETLQKACLRAKQYDDHQIFITGLWLQSLWYARQGDQEALHSTLSKALDAARILGSQSLLNDLRALATRHAPDLLS